MHNPDDLLLVWHYDDYVKSPPEQNITTENALRAHKFERTESLVTQFGIFEITIWLARLLKSGEFVMNVYVNIPTAKSHEIITLDRITGTPAEAVRKVEQTLFGSLPPSVITAQFETLLSTKPLPDRSTTTDQPKTANQPTPKGDTT